MTSREKTNLLFSKTIKFPLAEINTRKSNMHIYLYVRPRLDTRVFENNFKHRLGVTWPFSAKRPGCIFENDYRISIRYTCATGTVLLMFRRRFATFSQWVSESRLALNNLINGIFRILQRNSCFMSFNQTT